MTAYIVAALAGIAMVIAAAPEPASASRLSVEGNRVLYVTDSGERNTVVVTGGVRRYVVRDAGATIRVVAPCRLRGSSEAAVEATCPARGIANLDVQAGDEPDAVSINAGATGAVLSGGPGDDRLVGGVGPDQIDGGEGADVVAGRSGNDVLAGGDGVNRLNGGPGNDTVTGGDGADSLTGGTGDDTVKGGGDDDALRTDAGADSLDGGPGFDTLSYGGRLGSVYVALDGMANDGQLGEGDNVQATERIRGSRFDDVLLGPVAGVASPGAVALEGGLGNDILTGGPSADDLRGGPGDDRISGSSGSDVLTGGSGADTIQGDLGNDLVGAADGTADRIDCGDGVDSASVDRSDAGLVRCERNVPGGTPGGVSRSDVAPFYRFRPAKLRRRGRAYVVVFNTDVPGENVARRSRVPVRVTFRTSRGRRVGRPRRREVTVDTRHATRIVLRRVPQNARRVTVDVYTGIG